MFDPTVENPKIKNGDQSSGFLEALLVGRKRERIQKSNVVLPS